MVFHLIVTCVAQKKVKKTVSILDDSIAPGSLEEVFSQWQSVLKNSLLKRKRADELYNSGLWKTYCDSWGLVRNRVKDAQFWILSAGHGLVSSEEMIVPYDVTFQEPRESVPSILSKVQSKANGDARREILQGWWQALVDARRDEPRSLSQLFSEFTADDYALVVLGKDYLDAVFEDLSQGIANSPVPHNIAVISNNIDDPTAKQLGLNWLYADGRFVNLPRSNSTFVNARVAHNLLIELFDNKGGMRWWSLESFNKYLQELSVQLPEVKKFDRVPGSNVEVKNYIREELKKNDISFSRLHRQYRDGNRACEYTRFKGLYREVKEELQIPGLDAENQRHAFPVHYAPRQARTLFFLPDWDDRVDPLFDFENDASFPNRDPYEHDTYHYELFGHLNCDGILVSKSVIEDNKEKLKRIKQKGIHAHLRLPRNVAVLGDCGAFNYIAHENPPFETEETLRFYQELDFDYGVSIDHLIVPGILRRTRYFQSLNGAWDEVDKDRYSRLKQEPGAQVVKNRRRPQQNHLYTEAPLLCEETDLDEEERKRRYNLTINNARDFIEQHQRHQYTFIPIGAVQGWDPESYAEAVRQYQLMGYEYIALGGLVRSTTQEIMLILREVGRVKKPSTQIHLFGVARLDALKDFMDHGVTSVDSAGVLRQAWLSSSSNYHWPDGNHYTAIRVPPADQGAKVKKVLDAGTISHGELLVLEKRCLRALRDYDAGRMDIEELMDIVMSYHNLMDGKPKMEEHYRRTLQDKPWKSCPCAICQKVGIEVVVFRRNNRNRRRGFHNTWVFYNQFKELTAREGDQN